MKDEEILKKIGKKYGRESLSIDDLKRSIDICLNSRDFKQRTHSFRRQVMLDLFRLDKSLQSIEPMDRKVISNIIQKVLVDENKELKEVRRKKQKQCERELSGEAQRAGFEKYKELDNHLTIH